MRPEPERDGNKGHRLINPRASKQADGDLLTEDSTLNVGGLDVHRFTSTLAGRDSQSRERMLIALQRSQGNTFVQRMLLNNASWTQANADRTPPQRAAMAESRIP